MIKSKSTTGSHCEERSQTELKAGRLGVGALVFSVVSAMAPLTTITGMFPFGFIYGNGTGYPVAYLLAMTVLILFSVGYLTMMRHVKSAGAFYALVSRGLSGKAGGCSALVMLLGYNASQVAMQGMFGAVTQDFMHTYFAVDLPWWIYCFFSIFAIGMLGYRKVDFSLAVLAFLVVGEFLIVAAVDSSVIVHTASTFNLASFELDNVLSGSLPLALLMAIGSFLGFETTALYSEEAKNPEKTIPRATYLSLFVIGIFYCFSGVCVLNGMGFDQSIDRFKGMSDTTQFIYILANDFISPSMTIYVHFLLITSTFASMLAFHNAAARYFYVLGREGVLPSALGTTHHKHASPYRGSMLQTFIAVSVISFFAILKLDPMSTLFAWLGSVSILGIISVTALVSYAVIVFFFKHRGLESNALSTRVAPTIAAVLLTGISVSIVKNFGLFSGASGWIGVALPMMIPLFGVLGWLAAARLKAKDASLYQSLGQNRY
ncbi:APC family permease [Pseudomonas putida]|uniref:APC family permease n=1 Tax=Pseudomonas putida TaxID=303 RepID=UPI00383A9929